MKKLPRIREKNSSETEFVFMKNCRQLLHGGAFDVQNEVFNEFLHGGLFHEFHEHEHLAIILPHAVKLTVAGVCPLHECPCPVELDLTVVLALKISHLHEEMFSFIKGLDAAGDERVAHRNGHLCDVTYDFRILFLHVNLLRHSPCCIG